MDGKLSSHLETSINNYQYSGIWFQDFLKAANLNSSPTQRLLAYLLLQNLHLMVAQISENRILLEQAEELKFTYIIEWINPILGLNQLRVWAHLEDIEKEFFKIFLVSDLCWLLWAFNDDSKGKRKKV
ncbi:10034_t:CDS:2 [Diversispora eburnea]|uniref:10034_t:CDS:1 n=1 Tax=Diversispora eburnea TaxID=1213867 RepID=A0A9N8WR76_9GLOM|nr:10034_t:CDS:2 [Diversispora eburnea]